MPIPVAIPVSSKEPNQSHFEKQAFNRQDYYKSLDDLKVALKEGRDYLIEVVDQKSSVTIVSPHGGKIEPGTSELARELACNRYNLFDFQAVNKLSARYCHVTATRFRDQRLSNLLERSRICVSLHGMRDRHEILYLGGNNDRLKKIAAKMLKQRGFEVTVNPPRLRGESKNNFVNHAKEEGLQIEIPNGLITKLFPGIDKSAREKPKYTLLPGKTTLFKGFVEAMQETIEAYCMD